jgi:hypothetical protein
MRTGANLKFHDGRAALAAVQQRAANTGLEVPDQLRLMTEVV